MTNTESLTHRELVDYEIKILNHLRSSEGLSENKIIMWAELFGERMREVVMKDYKLSPSELIKKIEA